jgi:hypothetical protein
MAYGILAYNNTGKILISTDIQGLHFAGIAILSSTVQSLTRNFPNYNRDGYYLSGSWIHTYTITLPAASAPVFFIRPVSTNVQYGIINQYAQNSNSWRVDIIQSGYDTSYPPEIYAFTTAQYARLDSAAGLAMDTTGPGIATYLSNGTTLAFDSRKDPLGILYANQNVRPPQLPSDGGAPVSDTSYPWYWQDQNLDFNFKSDTTYTSYSHGLTDSATDLMFSAPSTAHSVRTRVKGGYKLSCSSGVLGVGGSSQPHYSTAQWWVFYIQTYGLTSSNTLIAGWTPYKAGYFYHEEYSSGGWFGSDSGQMSQGNRPYPDKTINWQYNTAMITKATNYILTPSWTVQPLYGSTYNVETTAILMYAGGPRVSSGTYYWTIKHGTTVAADFIAASGTVTVGEYSYGTFYIYLAEDNVFEGPQTFQVELRKTSITGQILKTSDTFTIVDKPSYSWNTYPSGPVNENSSLIFKVNTQNVPANTTLYWYISSYTATNPDFILNSGSFVINDQGIGEFMVSIKADSLTEPIEEFFGVNITTTDPNILLNYYTIVLFALNNIYITDTSQNPAGSDPTLGFNTLNNINVAGNTDTLEISIINLNTNGTIDYYDDNSTAGYPAPTTWFSPTSVNGSSIFEFKIIVNSVPTNCVLSYGRVSGQTGSRASISSQWDSGWWDLSGYTGFIQLYNSGTVNRTMTGTLYIRNKTTLTEISRSITMTAYGSIY